MSHLTPDELQDFVTGSLDPAASRRLEAHVEGCEACAKELAREARLEVSLLEVGDGLQPAAQVLALEDRRKRRLRTATLSALGVAVAAALVVVLSVERPTPGGKGPSINHCTDPHRAADCIAQGEFDGVISIGPDRQLIVPRYDAVARTP
jgi:hypothetical protein